MSCLSEQTIAQYVEAALDADATDAVEEHIDGCADCRLAIAETARGRAPSVSLSPPDPDGKDEEGPPRASDALLPGAQLGRYIVRRTIGAGGMGLVYAAYDPKLDREIALKILRPELTGFSDERGLPERLLREAQLMARLTHPNVVAVYDVGTLEGQVFVAMEMVIGETLRHRLSAAPRRSWREVLTLFLAAGRGLSAAHRVNVVHRDFKPDNVLVSQDGRVQVTDFGLARMARSDEAPARATMPLGESLAEGVFTRTGALIGTPAYMAPELLRGGEADERSDQFAFCVALYEGLYAERPFTGTTLDGLAAAIEQGAIVPRDSRVPAWLRRAVLRGLRARPNERWPSMDALINELARHLADRFWRWFFAAALLFIALVAGLAALRAQPTRTCRNAKQRLLPIWDGSHKEAVHRAFAATKMPYAEDAFAGVSAALDAYTDAWAAMHTEACEATWVRGEQSAELLDLRMQCLEKQRQLLQARVALYQEADVEAVRRAVSAAPSVTELRVCADAKELMLPVRPPADQTTRTRIADLGQRLASLRARYQAGQYAAGLKDAQLVATESTTISFPPLEAEAQLMLGDFQESNGEFADAESSFYRALWAGEAGKQDRIAVQAWTRLSYLVGYHQDRSPESQRLVQHADATLRRLGGDDVEKATLESAAGNIAWKGGRYDEALRRFALSRTLFEKTLGPNSIEVAEVLQRTSFALEPLARFEEAIAMERLGLEILIKRLGPEHPEVAAGRLRLGQHLLINEWSTTALAEMRTALSIYERVYPPDDIHVASALHGLASVLVERQQGNEALPIAQRALRIREQRLGLTHSDVGQTLAVHSAALLQTGQLDQALAEARRVETILAGTLGKNNVFYSFALLDLGHIHAAQHDYRRAIAMYRESLEVLKRSQVTDVWCFARPQLGIARAELAQNNLPSAIALLEETVTTLERDDPTSQFLPDACFELAQALALSHRDEPRVRTLAQRALTLYRKVDYVREEQRLAVERFLAQRPAAQ